jgi:uncharacterized protein with NRDE domain
MCLVFLAFQTDPDFPVMLGANREEARSRPSTPPVCVRGGAMRRFLAGADHGPDGSCPRVGTWLGVNEAGLVVAVTNRRDGELAPTEQTRSRGWLTVSLLGFDDPQVAARSAQGKLARGGYGGCNYLIVSRRAALVVRAPGAKQVSVQGLSPGIHALTNLDMDDGDDPRVRLVDEALGPGRFVATAQRICLDERIVVSGKERGTVSSSLVLVGDEIHFFHLAGDLSPGNYERLRPFYG